MQHPHREGLMEIVKTEREQYQPYYEGEYFFWIIGDMENACTFASQVIRVLQTQSD